MNKFILVISFLVLLSGCKSQKETNLKEDISTKYNSSDSLTVTSQGSSWIVNATDIINNTTDEYEVSQTIEEYDTSHPIDITTGIPPIKKKTKTILSKKSKGSSEQSNRTKTVKEDIKLKLKNSTHTGEVRSNVDLATKENTQKERVIFLKWIGSISLILLVLYILYRNRKIFLRFL